MCVCALPPKLPDVLAVSIENTPVIHQLVRKLASLRDQVKFIKSATTSFILQHELADKYTTYSMHFIAVMNRLANLCCHVLNDHAMCPPQHTDANIVVCTVAGNPSQYISVLYRNANQMQSPLKLAGC